jgi:hypothetical protein
MVKKIPPALYIFLFREKAKGDYNVRQCRRNCNGTMEFEISTCLSAIAEHSFILQTTCVIVVTPMVAKRTNCMVQRQGFATRRSDRYAN